MLQTPIDASQKVTSRTIVPVMFDEQVRVSPSFPCLSAILCFLENKHLLTMVVEPWPSRICTVGRVPQITQRIGVEMGNKADPSLLGDVRQCQISQCVGYVAGVRTTEDVGKLGTVTYPEFR
jgi:hypothetical protein